MHKKRVVLQKREREGGDELMVCLVSAFRRASPRNGGGGGFFYGTTHHPPPPSSPEAEAVTYWKGGRVHQQGERGVKQQREKLSRTETFALLGLGYKIYSFRGRDKESGTVSKLNRIMGQI